jgi:TolB-like protein
MKIFVSYRRTDSEGITGRIRDRLVGRYGDDSIFMDIDNIPFGKDLRQFIHDALAQSDIFMAVVGPQWLGVDASGNSRIHADADPVRIEVELAQQMGIPIIPVLIGNTTMPAAAQLPDVIKDFTFINAAKVDPGRDFHQHMERLIRSMDETLRSKNALPCSITDSAELPKSSVTDHEPSGKPGVSPPPVLKPTRLLDDTRHTPAGHNDGMTVATRRGAPTPGAPHLSMVVLPFTNLSGDPGQDHFVDGIVEALTTDLSRIPESFVIARNTAFTYKNKAVNAKQIGQELGVRYLIQGGIQFAGARLRVTVQLIHVATGSHLWAERFDHDRGDIFEIQDEIVTHLARTLDVELVSAESKQAALLPDLQSLDLTFQGWAAMYRGLNPNNLKEARRLFEQALVLDQSNVMALEGLADANSAMIVAYMTDDRAACLVATESIAMKALALAPHEAKAHASLALVYMWTNRVSQAISEFERALTLDRNLAFAHANIGIAKYLAGRPQETEDHIARAIRLSPRDTWLHVWCVAAGVAKLALCRDEEAVTWLHRAIETNRTFPLAHFFLASALACQGKINEARGATKEGLALDPEFTVRRYRDNPLSDNPTYLTQRKRIHEGMFAAGLPEH